MMTATKTRTRTTDPRPSTHVARVRAVPHILLALPARAAAGLGDALRHRGFAVAEVDDLTAGRHVAATHRFDLALVSQRLLEGPDADGLAALGRVPVLVVGAAHGWDVVEALTAGAVDAVGVDAPMDEVVARIRARLRTRHRSLKTARLLHSGGLTLDMGARRARVGDRDVALTAKEFALLEVLMDHPGQVLTRTHLMHRVWPETDEPASNIVDSAIARLRRKLGGDHITTQRGLGYRLTA